MYKEIIRQTTYMLNHHPVSALISPPSAGKSAIIREQICSQEHLSEENAAAMVFDIKPFANGADTLTAQFAAELRQEVKEPVFLDLSFKDDGSLWFAANRLHIKHKDQKRIYIIIDSAENLFTYPVEQQHEFAEAVASLLTDEIPYTIAQSMNERLMGGEENPLSPDAVTTLYLRPNFGIMFAAEQSILPNIAALSPAFSEIISRAVEIKPEEHNEDNNPYQIAINQIPDQDERNRIADFIQNEMIVDGGETLPAFQSAAVGRHGVKPQSLRILTQAGVFHRFVSPLGREYYTPAYQGFVNDFNHTHQKRLRREKRIMPMRILTGLAAVGIFIGLLAFSFHNAEYGSIAARSNMLSTFAFQKLETDPTFSLRLAQKAVEFDTCNQQAYSALLNSFYNTDIFYNISMRLTDSTGLASISPDCRYILASEKNYEKDYFALRVRTIDGGQTALISHPAEINCATMSAQGLIITACDDSIARIFTTDGHELKRITGHHASLRYAVFSPDGTRIATAGTDKRTMIWDTLGNHIATLEALDGDDVLYVSFSPDGSKIVTAGDDIYAKLWSDDGKLIRSLEIDENARFAISVFATAEFSPDGKYLLTASNDRLNKNHRARLWDMDGNQLMEFSGHKDWLNSAYFSSDGKMIITSSRDHTVRVFSITGETNKILKGHGGNVYTARFTPDCHDIVTVGDDKTVRTWNIAQRFETYPDAEGINFAGFSPDCLNLVVVKDTAAYLWDLTGEKAAEYIGHGGHINTARFSHNGTLVATAANDGTVRIWKKDGKLIKTIDTQSPKVLDAVFSPDDQLLVSIAKNNNIIIFNLDDSTSIRTTAHQGNITSIAFSPDGSKFATGGDDRIVLIHNLNGEVTDTLAAHTEKINSVAFSPDGEYVLSASSDKSAILWDKAGNPKHIYNVYESKVNTASFSPDGRYIVTTSDNGNAKIWTADGRDIITFAHDGGVSSAEFSPDGRYLLAAYRRTIKVRLLNARNINRHLDELKIYGPVWQPDPETAERYGM